MLYTLFLLADLSSTAGSILDFIGFLSEHWQAIGGILAAVVLLVQQWRTGHAAKTAADAAKVAASIAVLADNGAQVRDLAKTEAIKENTAITRDTQQTAKAIERMTNGEKTARIAHIELLEGMLRDAGKDPPPKPSILG